MTPCETTHLALKQVLVGQQVSTRLKPTDLYLKAISSKGARVQQTHLFSFLKEKSHLELSLQTNASLPQINWWTKCPLVHSHPRQEGNTDLVLAADPPAPQHRVPQYSLWAQKDAPEHPRPHLMLSGSSPPMWSECPLILSVTAGKIVRQTW